MKVLHVAHAWPPDDIGGTELYADGLARAQRAAGHIVDHWVPRLGRITRFEQTFRRAEADAAFLATCQAFQPDIVHVHHLSGASMDLPALSSARVVFTLHDAWLACARGQLVNDKGERCEGPSPRRCGACLATALWAPLPAAVATRLPARTARVRGRQEALARLLPHVDRFLTPSRHLAKRLGIEAQHLPLPLVRPIAPAPVAAPGAVRFLFLGSMIPTKGPHLALEAFATLPAGSATLTLAGPAPAYNGVFTYFHAVRRRASELPGVTMTTAIEPGAVQALLHRHDVLVFPSTWDENSPLTLREAAAAGLRIVASDIPGATEVLGALGARVEPGSAPALRRALAAEVAVGRARVPPMASEGMEDHARRVLEVYTTLGPRTR